MTRYIDSCPVGCRSEFAPTSLVLPEGPLLRCPECGQLVSQSTEERYLESMQEFDDPRGTLPDSASSSRRFALGKKWLDRISQLLQKSPRETRLLDVGCSSGAFLHTAKKLGFSVEGVEPAPKAAKAASDSGLPVHCGFLQDMSLPPESFDAITLFEVIEHLKDPSSLVRECRRILKPGGILLVGTGNAESWTVSSEKAGWEYFSITNHGGHVSFYNPISIRKLAESCGFETARIDTRNVRLVERHNASPALYRVSKFASELLNFPAKLSGKGHDMQSYFRKPQASPLQSR